MQTQTGQFHEILNYLLEYPDARDTIEGIAQWWVLEQGIKNQVTKLQGALAELVAQGLVIEHKGIDSRTSYQINKERYAEIKDLLNQGPKGMTGTSH